MHRIHTLRQEYRESIRTQEISKQRNNYRNILLYFDSKRVNQCLLCVRRQLIEKSFNENHYELVNKIFHENFVCLGHIQALFHIIQLILKKDGRLIRGLVNMVKRGDIYFYTRRIIFLFQLLQTEELLLKTSQFLQELYKSLVQEQFLGQILDNAYGYCEGLYEEESSDRKRISLGIVYELFIRNPAVFFSFDSQYPLIDLTKKFSYDASLCILSVMSQLFEYQPQTNQITRFIQNFFIEYAKNVTNKKNPEEIIENLLIIFKLMLESNKILSLSSLFQTLRFANNNYKPNQPLIAQIYLLIMKRLKYCNKIDKKLNSQLIYLEHKIYNLKSMQIQQ